MLISIPLAEKERLERSFDIKTAGIPYLSLIGRFDARGESMYLLEKGKKRIIHPTGKDEVAKLLKSIVYQHGTKTVNIAALDCLFCTSTFPLIEKDPKHRKS